MSAPDVRTNPTRPRGRPAAQQHSATISEQPGVLDDGFNTAALPAASAANTPPDGMATGKFQGGTTSTTPNGSNRARPEPANPGLARSRAR